MSTGWKDFFYAASNLVLVALWMVSLGIVVGICSVIINGDSVYLPQWWQRIWLCIFPIWWQISCIFTAYDVSTSIYKGLYGKLP